MAVSFAALNYFLPIFAFLLIFVVVYAVFAKTGILGDNSAVHLIISFILAVFFIVQVSLVDFIQFSSAWFAVFFVSLFLVMVLLAFTNKEGLDALMKNKGVAVGLLAGLVIFFIISSAYVFNWAVNWDKIWDWFYTDWFGMVLLLIIAIIVGVVISKGAGGGSSN